MQKTKCRFGVRHPHLQPLPNLQHIRGVEKLRRLHGDRILRQKALGFESSLRRHFYHGPVFQHVGHHAFVVGLPGQFCEWQKILLRRSMISVELSLLLRVDHRHRNQVARLAFYPHIYLLTLRQVSSRILHPTVVLQDVRCRQPRLDVLVDVHDGAIRVDFENHPLDCLPNPELLQIKRQLLCLLSPHQIGGVPLSPTANLWSRGVGTGGRACSSLGLGLLIIEGIQELLSLGPLEYPELPCLGSCFCCMPHEAANLLLSQRLQRQLFRICELKVIFIALRGHSVEAGDLDISLVRLGLLLSRGLPQPLRLGPRLGGQPSQAPKLRHLGALSPWCSNWRPQAANLLLNPNHRLLCN
mmetsp:Transcript_50184/g.162480  ORF Transcript_50184/g.162480 Transcript_50184/m.162480 type:complete len:356 (-) Transcript_50184:573-1640(-)